MPALVCMKVVVLGNVFGLIYLHLKKWYTDRPNSEVKFLEALIVLLLHLFKL